MSLLAPIGLAALVAVPLIILFHMRHTTPPRRPVASLRFWEAADPRPAEERRLRRPPLSLPLILQIAAALLLALALARPVTADRLAALAPDLRAEPQHLILLLDGSTSMNAVSGAGEAARPRWEAARAEALARLGQLYETDVATVMLLGTRPQTLTATDSASLASLRERLAVVAQPGGRASLDQALTLAGDLFLPNLERQVVVISDGAATVDPAVVASVDAPVELVIAGEDNADRDRANVAVTEIAARPSPDGVGNIVLYTSIANFGPSEVTASVQLLGDGLEIGRDQVTLAGQGGAESLSWILPPGIANLTIRVDGADALLADNSATILTGDTTRASIAPRILLVSDLPGALARALTAIENVELAIEPGDNVSAIAAGGYDLVIFDRTAPPLETAARIASPSLWIAPPVGGPFATTEMVVDPRVARVRAGDPVLAGVDLAGVTFGPTSVFTLAAGDEEIIGAADGPLLYRTKVNEQPALVLTADPEASNLPKRVAFPVLVANIVAELAPDGVPASIPLGEPLVYEPRAATASVEIETPSGAITTIEVVAGDPEHPSARSVVYSDTGAPGAYTVTESGTSGDAIGSARFVVNAGHPRESDLRLNPTLAPTLAGAQGRDLAVATRERFDLWPLLAIAALAVIAAEWAATLSPARLGGSVRPASRKAAS